MHNINAETAGIPANPFTHKQHLQCKKCGKRFVAVNGRIQEDGLEENPFTQPAEHIGFFDRLKKLVMKCPECGGNLMHFITI